MLGWLTPDLDDFLDSQIERSIVLPGSLFYLVTGALQQLADVENWEEFGDATPEATSQYFADILEDYLVSDMRNVGMIAAWTRDTAMPSGWIPMTGQTIAQEDYPELTNVVPASWISGSNIILPDARNRFLVGGGAGIPGGAVGGANTHTLTVGEMPNHSHTYREEQSLVNVGAGATQVQGGAVSSPTGTSGTGSAHNNMPAYLGIRWAIYAGR